jgi:hypothetical protein
LNNLLLAFAPHPQSDDFELDADEEDDELAELEEEDDFFP